LTSRKKKRNFTGNTLKSWVAPRGKSNYRGGKGTREPTPRGKQAEEEGGLPKGGKRKREEQGEQKREKKKKSTNIKESICHREKERRNKPHHVRGGGTQC